MKLKIFNKNIAEVNSYLLIKRKESILIDPGFNGQAIIDYCNEQDLNVKHVILTHGHFDHIKSIEMLAKHFSFNIYISKEDKPFLTNNEYSYATAFGSKFNLPDLEVVEVNDGEVLRILDESFDILLTPGHTKGSICIKNERMVFSGDTLFYNSVGRTDLYSGNQSELFKSLEKITKKYSNDVNIYPGHGEHGKLKIIKEINPFI